MEAPSKRNLTHNQQRTENDPFYQRFFARIPIQTAVTFTPEQLEALKQAYRARASREHPVDLRLTVPFFPRGFYFVLLAGKEKRHQPRRLQEKKQHPLTKTGNILFLTILLLVLAVLSVGGAYLLEQPGTKLPSETPPTSTQEK
ncbi:hypothetical protein [Geitlerinema sp. PCC 9228]|uniref:hypothetical protein n=1 Tax=Geitlerinema sp. PCC 9228 TaxID=111611 RepID=UPI0008F9A89C|nr:hypothetical protein [Geitlerinema sp. PCC 9228]